YVDSDYAQAQMYYEKAVTLARKIQSPYYESFWLGLLGLAMEKLWRLTDAKKFYINALEIAEPIGSRKFVATTLNNLGSVNNRQGNYQVAQDYYKNTLKIVKEIGHRELESHALWHLAQSTFQQNNYQIALEYSNQSLAMARTVGNPLAQIYALIYAGYALSGLIRYVKSVKMFDEAVQLCYQTEQENILLIEILAGLGHVYAKKNDWRQAREVIDEILVAPEFEDLTGAEEAMRIQWNCYHILTKSQSESDTILSRKILQRAYNQLQTQAQNFIDEGERTVFLEHITIHHMIVKEFTSQK
ncbi:MAG: tetratricopeptide repeat protein, partial [Chloroflexota bacterium]